MKTHRFRAVLASVVTVAACLLLAAPIAMADKGGGANKLEGTWVARVVGSTGQWSYVLVPDPSGRRASLAGSIDVGFSVAPLFGPTDRSSMLMANLVMTSPEGGVFNSVWYGLADLDPPSPLTAEVKWIGVSTGTFTFIAPGQIHVVHSFAFYTPDADVDGDGFPDADAVPAYETQVESIDTRLMPPQ